MSARKKYLLLACILIIATFLRLYHFTWTPPGLYPDEAMDGNNALEAYHAPNFWSALKVYYPEDNGREGLYVNTIALLMKATGGIHEPWIVRLPAAISGILTVLGMFYLVSELFREHDDKGSTDPGLRREDKGAFENWKLKIENSEVALLAAFLLATSFWHINFSRIGFRAIMAPLFLTWALYFLLKAIRAGNFQSSIFPPKADPPLADNFQKRWVFAVLGGISFGLGFYTYIAYRVSPLLLLLFVPFFRREKYFWKATLVFLAVAFVVALPIGLYYLHHPGDFFGRTSQISVSNSASPVKDLAVNIAKTLGMFNIHGDNNWRQNISGAPELYWPVGLLFLLGIVLGLRSFFKKEPPDSALSVKFSIFNFSAKGGSASGGQFSNSLLFLWFILAMLPVVLSDEGIPHALRSILMIPPVIIFAAIGGVALYRWLAVRMRASWLKPAAWIFLAVLAAQAYVAYFDVWAKNPNVPGAFNADYAAIGREINALPANEPKYVVVDAGGVLARGIPVPAETTMFITDTFTDAEQQAKSIHYLLPAGASTIPVGATVFHLQ